MSVFAKISRFFGFGSPSLESATAGSSGDWRPDDHAKMATSAPPRPREPVRIEIEPDDDDAAETAIEQATLPTAPKNKQELLAELRRNYAEAVGLIRKVDGHLDAQARRSDRMIDLAERAPEGVDHLAAIREGQSELAELARALRDLSREGRLREDAMMERQRDILERQASTLGRIEMLFEESGNVERELGEALGEFRGAILQMNACNHRVAGAIDRLDQREQAHEKRIDALAERGRTVTNALIVLCGLGVGTALVATLAVLYLVTR